MLPRRLCIAAEQWARASSDEGGRSAVRSGRAGSHRSSPSSLSSNARDAAVSRSRTRKSWASRTAAFSWAAVVSAWIAAVRRVCQRAT